MFRLIFVTESECCSYLAHPPPLSKHYEYGLMLLKEKHRIAERKADFQSNLCRNVTY